MKKRQCIVAILGLCIGHFAKAQDTVNFEEVVVAENRIPTKYSQAARSVVVIDKEAIQQMNAVSLNEVLSYVAGVDVRQRGAFGVQADVGIRGGSFDQTLILINDMKVSDPQTGHHNLNLPIDFRNIERIEILKGPAARIYGPNALAGAINIITKPGKEKSVFLGGAIGQFALHDAYATINLPMKGARQTLSFSTSGSDTFRYNTDFSIQNAFYQLTSSIQDWQINFTTGLNLKKFGANGFYGSSDFRDQYEETEAYFAGLQTEKTWKDRFTLRNSFYARNHHDDYVFDRENPEAFQNIHQTQILAAESNLSANYAWGTMTVGADLRQENINSSNLGERSRSILGAFADIKWLKGQFMVNPGVNLSSISDYSPQVFPGLDISYFMHNNSSVYLSTGTAFRVPTFTDLYYQGRENIGNENLDPERSRNIELGFKRQSEFYALQTAVFYRQTRNAIEWVRESDSALWQPRNFHTIKTLGAEFSWQVNMLKLLNNQSFWKFVHLSYTYLNSDFFVQEDLSSKYQMEFLRNQLVFRSGFKVANHLELNGAFRFIDRYHFSPYTLVDLRLSYKTDSWNAFVEGTNIFDTKYRETNLVRMPGRWLRIGANFQFNF